MKQTGTRRRWQLALSALLLTAGLAWGDAHWADSAAGPADFRDYTLTVASDHPTPTPAVGVHTYAWRATVTCSVADDSATHDPTGWTGTGSVPATGTGLSTGPLVLDEVAGSTASSITWTWQATGTYMLTVTNGIGDGSYTAGTVVTVTANTAPDGQEFVGWTANPSSYASNLANANAASTVFTMPAAAVMLTANYTPVSADPFGAPVVYPGTAMTVLVGASLLAGPAATGDVVGAFVGGELRGKSAVTVLEGVAYANLTIYVNQDGETVSFRLYDASAATVENGNRTLVAHSGTSVGTPQAPFEVVFGLATLSIALDSGWNLVSLNLRPTDPSCDAVFADIAGVLTKAIGNGGNYTPGWGPLNTFTEFADGSGYWVQVSSPVTWTVQGTPLDRATTPIALSAGWNNIAFIGNEASTVDAALAGIMGQLEKVIGDGSNYTPGWGPLNTLTTMRPGVGYWVRMSSPATLTYGFAAPASRSPARAAWRATGSGWVAEQPSPPATAHTILAAGTLGGTPLTAGSVLGVFVDGQCRAAAEAILANGQSFFNLTVLMGSAGDVAEFRLYDAATGTVHETDFTMVLTPGASNGTPQAPVEIAFGTTPPVQHTVTFKPGLHGTLAGGSPDVAVQAADGDPMPAPPQVTPTVGWTHTGWDWQPAGRSNVPPTITQDWTATALYEEAVPAPVWSVSLNLSGGFPGTLTLGMHADATDGWDAGLDEAYPLPGPGQACLASDDLFISYSADYRAPGETAEFLLIASAGADQTLTVSWDLSALPEGKQLSIYEVLLDGIAPARAPVARTLVGNTALDMAVAASLEIPTGETRAYVIRYGDELVFDLAFAKGWNLVSLPIQPLDPAADAVLADGLQRNTVVELRDGLRGTIHSGAVWAWQGQSYADSAEIHACVGYWVYADEPAVLLVRGMPVEQNALTLAHGWNIIGPTRERSVPVDARIRGPVWLWNAPLMRYQPTDRLLPGHGHWINASEGAEIPFPAEDR